jgi:hypothetical protein
VAPDPALEATVKLLVAFGLLAHALIHVSWLTPAPPQTADGPQWPFDVARSWLVTGAGLDASVARLLAVALVAVTVACFAMAALATFGWGVPTAAWTPFVVGGAAASLALLVAFFHPWLSLGIVIDLVILWAATILSWTPADLA